MKWRHLILILGVSFLLHLAVFWPSPESRLQGAALSVFSVRIVPAVSGAGISDLAEKDAMSPLPTPESSYVPRRSEVKTGSLRSAGADKSLAEPGHGRMSEAGSIASWPEVNSVGEDDLRSQGQTDGPVMSETGSLARYRMSLAAAALRVRAGVDSADNGLTGTAVVEVRFSSSTSVPKVTLSRSSGFEQLDDEAVALLARAVHEVPVSDAGQVGDVSLRLPVVFESVRK